jgi:hypothetical protein
LSGCCIDSIVHHSRVPRPSDPENGSLLDAAACRRDPNAPTAAHRSSALLHFL